MNTTVPLQAAPEPSAPPDRARAAQDGCLAGVASRADEFGAAQALPQVRHLRQALEESGGRQSALRLEECDGRSALPAGALLLPGGPGEEPDRRMNRLWHFVLAASTDTAAMESPHPQGKAEDGEGGRMQGRHSGGDGRPAPGAAHGAMRWRKTERQCQARTRHEGPGTVDLLHAVRHSCGTSVPPGSPYEYLGSTAFSRSRAYESQKSQ